MTFRLAILISGRGSNMMAIHRAVLAGRLNAEITLICSDQAGAAGLQYAEEQGIPTQVIQKSSGESREEYDRRLIECLDQARPDLVVLAGFMRLLSPAFVRHYSGKLINIHPSLLPKFPGLHAQAQALAAGVKESGCTVHFVDEGCDTGPIIAQAKVPVLPGDDEDSLSERILQQEHRLYAECIEKIAQGKIKLDGKRVIGL